MLRLSKYSELLEKKSECEHSGLKIQSHQPSVCRFCADSVSSVYLIPSLLSEITDYGIFVCYKKLQMWGHVKCENTHHGQMICSVR